MFRNHISFMAAFLFASALTAVTPFERMAQELNGPSDEEDVELFWEAGRRHIVEHIWWIRQHLRIGNEEALADFPTIPSSGSHGGLVSLVSHSRGVSYSLSGFNPPRPDLSVESISDLVISDMNDFPLELEEFRIEVRDEGGISILLTKQINRQTGERIRSKFVVTRRNSYVMEVRYKSHHEAHVERFFNSFEIKR